MEKKNLMTGIINIGVDEKTANEAFQSLLKRGYGALDYNTYGKVVPVQEINKEQRDLSILFDLILTK